MFAIHIVFNESGSLVVGESLQTHVDSLDEVPKLMRNYGFKENDIKFIEIVKSSKWSGWKY